MMLAGARGAPPGLRLVRDEHEPIVLAHETPFRIGEAEFRPATREVLFDGDVSIVEPRVMQVLVALERAEGGVVTKDELAALCWEGRIVGEDAINRVVSRLRAVAAKQAGGQFRLETITKVGYRLVAASGGPAVAPGVTSAGAAGAGMGRREFVIGGSVLGIAAVAGAGWFALARDAMPRKARTLLDQSRDLLLDDEVEGVSSAVGKARAAIELAPNQAEPWGLLAYAYMKQASLAPGAMRAELRARGLAAAKKASSLEPGQADATAATIAATPPYRNWLAYDGACHRGLGQHPDNRSLKLALCELYASVGRSRECIDLEESMIPVVERSPRLLGCYFVMLWEVGRIDEAETVLANAYAQWPRYFGIWFNRLYYLMYSGRAQEAVAMAEDVPGRPIGIPDWNFDLVTLGVRAQASGSADEIRKAILAWCEAGRKGTGFTENAAIFAAFNGDHDSAFRMLDALYFNRGFAMPDTYFASEQGMFAGAYRHTYNLFVRPMAGLRKDPRFGQLTRELGLDDYWARTNSRSLVVA